MKFIAITTLLAAPIFAFANCVGSPSFQTCTDASGNSYSVQRFGNTTAVQGRSLDGSNWSQQTQTIGNTTYQNGWLQMASHGLVRLRSLGT